jgi:hypothetical protein
MTVRIVRIPQETSGIFGVQVFGQSGDTAYLDTIGLLRPGISNNTNLTYQSTGGATGTVSGTTESPAYIRANPSAAGITWSGPQTMAAGDIKSSVFQFSYLKLVFTATGCFVITAN